MARPPILEACSICLQFTMLLVAGLALATWEKTGSGAVEMYIWQNYTEALLTEAGEAIDAGAFGAPDEGQNRSSHTPGRRLQLQDDEDGLLPGETYEPGSTVGFGCDNSTCNSTGLDSLDFSWLSKVFQTIADATTNATPNCAVLLREKVDFLSGEIAVGEYEINVYEMNTTGTVIDGWVAGEKGDGPCGLDMAGFLRCLEAAQGAPGERILEHRDCPFAQWVSFTPGLSSGIVDLAWGGLLGWIAVMLLKGILLVIPLLYKGTEMENTPRWLDKSGWFWSLVNRAPQEYIVIVMPMHVFAPLLNMASFGNEELPGAAAVFLHEHEKSTVMAGWIVAGFYVFLIACDEAFKYDIGNCTAWTCGLAALLPVVFFLGTLAVVAVCALMMILWLTTFEFPRFALAFSLNVSFSFAVYVDLIQLLFVVLYGVEVVGRMKKVKNAYNWCRSRCRGRKGEADAPPSEGAPEAAQPASV